MPFVEKVAFVKFNLAFEVIDILDMAFVESVKNTDFIAACQQIVDEVTPEETVSAEY